MSLQDILYPVKYKLVFLRKEFDTVNVVKVKVLKSLKKLEKDKKKRYVLDIEHPAYVNRNIKYYFIDYDSGSQFHLIENPSLMNPEELDMIVGNRIIKELTSGVMDNKKEKLLMVIVGAIIGGLLATSIVLSIMNKKISDIYENINAPPTTIIPAMASALRAIWRV